jgi:hypothetical protein
MSNFRGFPSQAPGLAYTGLPMMLLPVLVLSAFVSAPAGPDYAGLHRQGITFSQFLENAGRHAERWQRHYDAAVPGAELLDRIRRQKESWQILVVADAGCSDSVNTVPYLAKLVDGAGAQLALRIVDPAVGRAVMEAHRTPDGRAATPTVILMRGDAVRVWVERPSSLQAWYLEKKNRLARRDLVAQKNQWYEEDAGRSTVAEIVGLMEGTGR